MIDYKFLLIGVVFIIAGIIPIIRNRFYNLKEKDMLWATSLGSFLSAIIVLLFGLAVFIYEISKLLSY